MLSTLTKDENRIEVNLHGAVKTLSYEESVFLSAMLKDARSYADQLRKNGTA